MASAERIPEVTQVVTPEQVRLTLSAPEAETLAVILAKIGGSTTLSARAHADSIGDALSELGYSWEKFEDEARFKVSDVANHITFEDYKQEASTLGN